MKLVPLTFTALSTIAGVTAIASAQRIDVEAFNKELAALERSLTHPAPGPGLDRASSGPPRWCRGGPVKEIEWPSKVASNLEQYRANKQPLLQPLLVSAAAAVCTYDAPAYHHAATEILQHWINETGLSEADAVASLAARIDPDAWQAEHDQLCHALGSGDSHDKEQSAMAEARVRLFGCDGTSHSVGVGWMTVDSQGVFDLYPFLDRGAMERDRDEIVRLAYLSSEINLMLDPREQDHPQLARYAVVQYDLHEFAPAQAVRQLDAAPYRGNRFARTVVVETLAHTKLTIARLEAAVASRTQNQRWKELLITVPQRAAAAWLDAADRHRDALARSDAMAAAIAAGDDAAHGCEAKLRADIAPIVRQLARGAGNDVEDRLAGDPLLGLLLSRLAACLAFEGDRAPAQIVHELASHLGIVRGPRAAANTATAAAAGAMQRQAPFSGSNVMPDFDHGARREPGRIHASFGTVVIRSMKPVGKRGEVRLTFPPERYQYTEQDCRETNRVDKILSDGTLVYRKVCRDLGKKWAERVPQPIVVPASCKAGLAVGHSIGEEHGIPVEVYADRAGKRLLALACLPLQ